MAQKFDKKPRDNKNRNIVIIIISIIVFFAFILPFIIVLTSKETITGNVALIKINGMIVPEEPVSLFGEAFSSSEEITKLIEKADSNQNIKAILVEIDSPGGSAVASEEIMNAIKKTKKPTIALIRDVGTSGAYWAASSADKVIASPVSITGSIGVFSSYLEFSQLMEKYGIKYERLVAGEYKDIGIPFRNLTDEEKKLLQERLNIVHDYFIKSVAENRNLSEEQVRNLSTGIIYLGVQAKELNLVDELGGREKAEEIIKEKTGLKKVELVEFKEEKGFLDILSEVFSRQSFSLGQGIGNGFGKILVQQNYGFRV